MNRAIMYLVAVFVTFSVIQCGKNTPPPSNIPDTNESAENEINARLAKTESIRRQVRTLNSSLAPVEAILSDVSGALTTRVTFEDAANPKIDEFLRLLQRLLREATEGIVTHHSDGSWSMVREVNLLKIGSMAKCQNVTIQFVGKRVGDSEQLTVSANDCSVEHTEHVLAVLKETAGTTLSAETHPEVLKHFFNGDFKQGQCNVVVSKESTKVNCKPFTLQMGTMSLKTDSVFFEKTPAGISALAHATVFAKEGKTLAEAHVIAQPGKKTEITVKTY